MIPEGVEPLQYIITKRYSELRNFHKFLLIEMKNYLKKKLISVDRFPEFPPKKLFNNSGKDFITKRIKGLNHYFNLLFDAFPEKVPFTNTLIDLCLP